MSYLYGDSTPSPLEVNFVDFLRDSLDFCVELSLSTDGLQREAERGDALRSAARGDIDRLEKLGSGVALAVKSLSVGEGDSPTARCALAIIRSTSDRVRSDVQEVNAALETEEAKLEVARAGERQNCVKALGQLLLRHDLPESSATLTLKARANAPYAAQLRTASSLGVVATIELEVPSSDLFGHVVRVDRVLDRLEVEAPEVGGWLHKERKMRPQRLEKLHLIELELPDTGLAEIYQTAVVELGASIPIKTTRTGSTDHASFRPLFLATGVTEGFTSGDTTPYYHKVGDTWDTVKFGYLASTTALVNRVMADLSR